MKTSLKDWPKVYRKIESLLGGKSEDEKISFARSLAATPEERMEMNFNCLKFLNFTGRIRSRRDLERRKSRLRRVEKMSLWCLRLSNEEIARGQMFGVLFKIVARCQS